MADPTPEFVIGAYHQLWHVEKVVPDVQARPTSPPDLPPQAEWIQAHLNVVFAALAVTRLVGESTGWSIKKFVRTARRYRTIALRVGQHTITAADPLPATCARRTGLDQLKVRTSVARLNLFDGWRGAGSRRRFWST